VASKNVRKRGQSRNLGKIGLPSSALADFPQATQEPLPLLIIMANVLPSAQYVTYHASIFDPRLSKHVPSLTPTEMLGASAFAFDNHGSVNDRAAKEAILSARNHCAVVATLFQNLITLVAADFTGFFVAHSPVQCASGAIDAMAMLTIGGVNLF